MPLSPTEASNPFAAAEAWRPPVARVSVTAPITGLVQSVGTPPVGPAKLWVGDLGVCDACNGLTRRGVCRSCESERTRDPTVRQMPGPVQSTGTPRSLDALVDELRNRGLRVERRGSSWWSQCPCPEHDDQNPSCEIKAGSKVAFIVKCWSGPGCTQEALLAAIGPPPGWRNEPLVLLLPERLEDCLCTIHEVFLAVAEDESGELSESEREEGLRWAHLEQRQRIRRIVVVVPGTSPSSTRLLRARPCAGVVDWMDLSEVALAAPGGMGRVMRLVLEDLVSVANKRLASGELRAVPYASRWGGERLGVDARQVREALARLCKHGVVAKVGELPLVDGRWDDGTPLYALAVEAPCPLASSNVEARASVAGLDAENSASTGDGQPSVQPRPEQPEVPAVAAAKGEDVVGTGLAAPIGGAGSVGHDQQRYAERRRPKEPDNGCPLVDLAPEAWAERMRRLGFPEDSLPFD